MRKLLVVLFLIFGGIAQANPPGTFQPLLLAASSPITITYIGNTSDGTNQTTYTFTGVSIGTASSDRVVIVAPFGRANTTSSMSISSITVGGNTPTTNVAQTSGGGSTSSAQGIYSINVPSGTTATIAVTFSTGALRANIAVWTMTGTNGLTTASATANSITGSPTVSTTINVPANGGAVASASGGGSTTTWTGLTEDFDTLVEAANTYTGSHNNFLASQTGLSVSANFSGGTTDPLLVVASWGP